MAPKAQHTTPAAHHAEGHHRLNQCMTCLYIALNNKDGYERAHQSLFREFKILWFSPWVRKTHYHSLHWSSLQLHCVTRLPAGYSLPAPFPRNSGLLQLSPTPHLGCSPSQILLVANSRPTTTPQVSHPHPHQTHLISWSTQSRPLPIYHGHNCRESKGWAKSRTYPHLLEIFTGKPWPRARVPKSTLPSFTEINHPWLNPKLWLFAKFYPIPAAQSKLPHLSRVISWVCWTHLQWVKTTFHVSIFDGCNGLTYVKSG